MCPKKDNDSLQCVCVCVCVQADQVQACAGDSAYHRATKGGHHLCSASATAEAASHTARQDVKCHQGDIAANNFGVFLFCWSR